MICRSRGWRNYDESAKDIAMTGKVISLGQVIVDLTMNVDAVPRAGEDVFAGNVQTQVGASFNTLYAVRRMGVKESHAGVIATGPRASQILQT